MSTLTETRNRADLLLIVGTDVHKLHDRFFDRIVTNPHIMFKAWRRSARWCSSATTSTPRRGRPAHRGGHHAPVAKSRIPEVLGASPACALPRSRARGAGSSRAAKRSGILARSCRAAPSAARERTGARDRRRPFRCHRCRGRKVQKGQVRRHGVGAAGTEHAAGRSHRAPDDRDRARAQPAHALCRAVARRQRGRAQRRLDLHLADRLPAARQLRQRQARVRLLSLQRQPHADRGRRRPAAVGRLHRHRHRAAADELPTIVLGTPGVRLAQPPTVYIPVGTPGVDHAGSMVRCDNVVSLPLKNLGRSKLPSAADVLAAIEAAL